MPDNPFVNRFETSDQQRGILQRCASTPAAGTRYNSPLVLHLGEAVDYPRLNTAFARLVGRHEMLRTGFVKAGDAYYQVVHPTLPGGVEDATGTPVELAGVAAQRAGLPFGLDGRPLLRATLYQARGEGYVLWLDKHLLLADHAADRLLEKELRALYDGQEPEAVRIQYADYALWQRGPGGAETAEENAQYWLAQLQGYAPRPVLPGQPEPAAGEADSQTITWDIGGELLTNVRQKCAEHQVSAASLLLGVYYVLLYTLSGEEDIVVTHPVPGRNDDLLRQTVGYFEQHLPLRKIISGEVYLSDLCRSLEENCRLAGQHQEGAAAALAGLPGFGREATEPALHFPAFAYNPFPGANTHPGADHAFCLSAADRGDALALRLTYNAARIDRRTAEQVPVYIRQGLTCAVQPGPVRIREIDLVSPPEKHHLLTTFNDTRADFGPGRTVLDLFADQVAQQPGSVAVVFGNQALRYDQLHRLSNQFAHYLQRQYAVRAGDRVGLLAGLSEWTLVSMLGVLKAGAAFVPIDPEAPWESTRYKLADAGVTVLIAPEVPAGAVPCPVLSLASQCGAIAAAPAADLPHPAPQTLAYVLYTSGTTGQAKGVAVRHASFYNYISWARGFYQADRLGNMPLFTSLAFDLTLTSVFLPISSGHAVHISPSADVVESLRLAFAPGNGVDTVKLTPSHILMLPYLGLTHTEVRQVIAGGEKLTPEHVLTLQKLNAAITLYDEYGPTEATVGCVAVKCTPATQGTVGRPISNTEIYILDEAGKVLPLGAKGEIYIGGACLAEGYFGKQQLTAEKFVPNPFRAGESMYRTGDLGRWQPDGNLAFYGRCDDQIKFYGNRIQPEEIEAAVRLYEGIRRCVVVKRTNAAGEDILVVYYVAGSPVEVVALQQFLAGHLAKSVIPTHFVHLRKLPLTLNGKLNYQALPDPETVTGSINTYVAPVNETEEKLARIWREVLDKARIGTRDNFFELGGHSLKATRIVSQVYNEFGVQVPLRSVFHHPTVQALAAYVSGLPREGAAPAHPAPAKAAAGTPPPGAAYYPAYHRQAGEWVMNKLNKRKGLGSYNMQWSTRLAAVDRPALERTLATLVSRHETLRSTLHLVNGEVQQRVHATPPGPLLVWVDLRGEADAGQQARHQVELARKQFFDFEAGPLFSAHLIQLEAEHYFVFTINHAISDAWSLTILEAELTQLYGAYAAGRPDPLPPAAVQAKDYAAWEKACVNGAGDQQHRAYWHEQLGEGLPLFYLSDYYTPRPGAEPRPHSYRETLQAEIRQTIGEVPAGEYPELFGLLHRVKTYNGALFRTAIRGELFEKLAALGAQTHTTLFKVLLAGINLLLCQLTGKADVVTGIQVLTRDDESFKHLVGWLINTVFFRQRIDDGLTFRQLVSRTDRDLDEAFAHKVYPMEKLLAELDVSLDALGGVNLNYLSFDSDGAAPGDFSHGHQPGNYFPYFDLDCYFFHYANGIGLQCIYKTDLFTPETIELFCDRYLALLEQVAGHPEEKLKAVLAEPTVAQTA